MPSFTIKVPNNDDCFDLGLFEADYLPRVGDPFVVWSKALCPDKDSPFVGVVERVDHEVFVDDGHPYAKANGPNTVVTTVWLIEEQAPPTRYCCCTEEEKKEHGTNSQGECVNCGHDRGRW
jgi:hypothetical protein